MKSPRPAGKLWLGEAAVLPPKSMSDQVYELLKKKILFSEIDPGARLMQEEVAEAFGASRTPVKEAFLLLEQDGLVERLAQGGVRVTQVEGETVREVFRLRGVLEAYGLELACEHIQPEGLATLRKIWSEAMALVESLALDREAKIRHLFELTSRFHETIYRAAGSNYLIILINTLRNAVLRLRALGLREDHTWREVWREHRQLIEHLERRDGAAAAALMRVHLAKAESYVLAALKAAAEEAETGPAEETGA